MELLTIHEYNDYELHQRLLAEHKVLSFLFDKEHGVVGTGLYHFVADAVANPDGTYDVYVMNILGNLTGDVLVIPGDTKFEVVEHQLRYSPDYILARDGEHILGTMSLTDSPLQIRSQYKTGEYKVSLQIVQTTISSVSEADHFIQHIRIAQNYMMAWNKVTVNLINL